MRRYLKALVGRVSGAAPSLPLLAEAYDLPPEFEQPEQAGAAALVMRALVGAVAVAEGEAALRVEDQLFEKAELPANEWEALVAAELTGGRAAAVKVFALPKPVELWDVPREGLALSRIISVRRRAREADGVTGRLRGSLWLTAIDETPEGLLIKLEARKTAEPPQPLFTYTWSVAEALETAEDVLDDFEMIAQEHGARLLMPGELPPDTHGWRTVN